LWGDTVDPDETEVKQKRVKEEKEEIKQKRPSWKILLKGAR
jgi:hypothetical protein